MKLQLTCHTGEKVVVVGSFKKIIAIVVPTLLIEGNSADENPQPAIARQ